MACKIEKKGSPACRSTMYRFVKSAVIPPIAPASAVLVAATAETAPAVSIPRINADPGLNPNPIKEKNIEGESLSDSRSTSRQFEQYIREPLDCTYIRTTISWYRAAAMQQNDLEKALEYQEARPGHRKIFLFEGLELTSPTKQSFRLLDGLLQSQRSPGLPHPREGSLRLQCSKIRCSTKQNVQPANASERIENYEIVAFEHRMYEKIKANNLIYSYRWINETRKKHGITQICCHLASFCHVAPCRSMHIFLLSCHSLSCF